MSVRIGILACLIFLFASCRKEKVSTTTQTIKGMVFNNCTDSGLAGVDVYLKISKDNSEFKSYHTVSAQQGNFTFDDVELYNSDKYSYAIYIPSKSGIGATTPEYCGFDGTTMHFSKNEAELFLKPHVTPRFLYLCYASTTPFPIVQPDSINIFFEQKIFHKNVPDLPYSGQIGNHSTLSSCTSNYPMGWWYFHIQKWKGGSYTTSTDSLYLGAADNKTYTVNW